MEYVERQRRSAGSLHPISHHCNKLSVFCSGIESDDDDDDDDDDDEHKIHYFAERHDII